jgi:hypothetical protein
MDNSIYIFIRSEVDGYITLLDVDGRGVGGGKDVNVALVDGLDVDIGAFEVDGLLAVHALVQAG